MTSTIALAAIGGGIALLVWSVTSNLDDIRRPLSDPTKALGLTRWLRTTILGLALVIAGEETLETTSVIRAMERYPGMALESVVRRRRRR